MNTSIKIKNRTSVILSFKFLAVVVILCLSSCSEEVQVDLNEYGINTSANRQAVVNLLNNKSALADLYGESQAQIQEVLRPDASSSSADENPITYEELMAEYESCSTCSEGHKDLLIPLIAEVSEASDDEVISVVEKYENEIALSEMSNETKSDLYFLTFSFKTTMEAYLQEKNNAGFWDCFRKKAGRAIGEGIAVGFLTGCTYGAYVGGTAGTVVVPFFGTVVGGVAGCVLGGTSGAIIGAVGNTILAAGKCLFN